MSAAWSRAGCLVAVMFSLAFVPAAEAAPLRLDAGFGVGGIARARFSSTDDLRALRPVRQPDGKVLVAAANYFFHGNSQILIARFTRRGRPDPTFGHRGRERLPLRWNFDPQAVHVQRDGRILVLGAAGYGGLGGGYPAPGQLGLARLLPNGSRDRTFGTNGFVTWNPPWRADTHSMYTLPGVFVPQADGRVLAAGVAEETRGPQGQFGPPQTSVRRIAFVRFNRDGSVDQSFGRDGVVDQFEGRDFFYDAWAALRDGQIVTLASHRDEPGPAALWMHRFTADGVADGTFGTNGALRLETNGLTGVGPLLAARDGSLVLIGSVDVGQGYRAPALRRILPDGRLDTTFANACRLPPLDVTGAAATPAGGLLAITWVAVSRLVRYGSNGCAVGRPLRLRSVSPGPPLLQGPHKALIGGTDTHGLALIRIRR